MRAINGTNHLGTCHHVGLDGTDGDYDGGNVDRSAIQWLKLQLSSGAVTMSHSSHGRLYHSASSNPCWYYMPSIAVNAAGDMVLGFSGSRATEHIGAFFAGQTAGGVTTNPYLVQAGGAYYAYATQTTPPDSGPGVRWGDYSFTCLDPDGNRFWTVQEYAEIELGYPAATAWRTWIMTLALPQ
ncbi:MAG: hypothetical protein H7A47_05960 [Verrucomicrobiales bacterium]|nr:hypothetical protein [Verrucomicrobiales bacterium]